MFNLTTEAGINKLEKCIDELENNIYRLRRFIKLFKGGSIFEKKIDNHVKLYDEILYVGKRASRISSLCNYSFRNIIRTHFERIYKRDFIEHYIKQPLKKGDLFRPLK